MRNLLCLLTKDLQDPTQNLCNLIHNRVKLTLSGIPLANIDTAVRHEMALLEALVSQNDSCWEQKLRVVLEIFLMACRQVNFAIKFLFFHRLRIEKFILISLFQRCSWSASCNTATIVTYFGEFDCPKNNSNETATK